MTAIPPNTAARSLDDVTLDPDAYAADLAVNERAQTFAAEIVRLGLLAIGGIGFLLAHPVGGPQAPLRPAWLLWIALLCLAGAVGLALLHRYFSTDCIVCQVAILRLIKRIERLRDDPAIASALGAQLGARRERQRRDMDRCRWLTWTAASLLGAGSLCVAALLANSYAA
jgi:hypothetical protein